MFESQNDIRNQIILGNESYLQIMDEILEVKFNPDNIENKKMVLSYLKPWKDILGFFLTFTLAVYDVVLLLGLCGMSESILGTVFSYISSTIFLLVLGFDFYRFLYMSNRYKMVGIILEEFPEELIQASYENVIKKDMNETTPKE